MIHVKGGYGVNTCLCEVYHGEGDGVGVGVVHPNPALLR